MKQVNWVKSTFVGKNLFRQEGHSDLKVYEGHGYKLVKLYPKVRYNTFEGFGGAATDAAGHVFAQMSSQQKSDLIDFYFGEENCHYQVLRVPMDSSDFSTEHYEALQDPNDETLENLDFTRELQYTLPLLKAAQAKSDKALRLLLSPWSPPAFMKTTGERNQGGQLKPEFYDFYASYLCKYFEKFQELGFIVERLTVQNEPEAVQTWDSCIYTAEDEKAFVRDHLYPAMKAAGLMDVEILSGIITKSVFLTGLWTPLMIRRGK